MKIYLVPNVTKPELLNMACRAAEILAAEGAQPLMDAQYEHATPKECNVQFMSQQMAYETCDIVVTIGGDGTMLHTARQTIHCQKPMVGVNMGRLGFLTLIENDELDKLRRLPKGEYTVEHRSLLQVEWEGDAPFSDFALNDVVLFKHSPDRSISLDIYCNDIKVSGFRGDGMIFATPTGSTAYSMSAGGPILDAALGGMVATQICAHIVHTPPMVFAGERVLKAVPCGGEDERVLITCDGMQSVELPLGTPVVIRQSPLTLPLVEFHDAGQLKSIDKKLKGR